MKRKYVNKQHEPGEFVPTKAGLKKLQEAFDSARKESMKKKTKATHVDFVEVTSKD